MRVEDETSARSAFLATRPISRDNLVPEDPALGLIAFSSPFDPEPSLRIEDGRIAELAAAAVELGFRELETTVPVLRDAPSNALALLIGSQVAGAGALTQCSVEERTELELGMRGLTTYAETVSVYGTEQVFVDGDDTPWSKAFLASCYASRGLKMRFTSGSGAEVLMGASEGKSMLYLEARCIAV